MFTIRFVTDQIAPNQTVTMRWGPQWELDRGGVYVGGAWTFVLDEAAFPAGLEFKFVLAPGRWMAGPNLVLARPQLAGVHDYVAPQVVFEPVDALATENGLLAQRFFPRNLDAQHEYDVIVVGSGMGGGLLASQLAGRGADVLVLEAGSLLFPTHVGNLARRLRHGRFDKHVWSLWPDFRVVNYTNAPGSLYEGGQAFNLGGRSVFWGGLIPRQAAWELAAWPQPVRDALLGGGFDAAEQALNRVPPAVTPYQQATRQFLQARRPDFVAEDAPVAVQYRGASALSIPAGLFSTADLLLEDRLVEAPPPGATRPTVNHHLAVWSVLTDPARADRVIGVRGWDLLGQRERSFRARTVVLAAGTIESAKIALQSGLNDPNGKIGRGLTDHTIRYRHFALPPGSAHASAAESAKVVLTPAAGAAGAPRFDVVVELGASFNQGRYVDARDLAAERAARNDWMLGEIVLMSYAPLDDANGIVLGGGPEAPVRVSMRPTPPMPAELGEQDAVAADLLAALGAQPLLGDASLALQTAALGGVAHEVGTLRMAGDGSGVVDADLKFLAYQNLYACDNSVFPASPAANPSLTLAALALRLARHLQP
jgi:choline dehydrogenase-like flavoprotein